MAYRTCTLVDRFPRLRGDEPDTMTVIKATTSVFPAYAGMSPKRERWSWYRTRFPRLRGDEPPSQLGIPALSVFSPPTRG